MATCRPVSVDGGAAAIALVVLVLSTYFTIDEGERGVILHKGAIVGEAGPGLHFKMPIITTHREDFGADPEGSLREDRRTATPGCRPIRATSSPRPSPWR